MLSNHNFLIDIKKFILNIGAHNNLSKEDAFKVNVINFVAISACVINAFALIYFVKSASFIHAPVLLQILLGIVVLYLNSREKYVWATMLLLVLCPLFQFVYLDLLLDSDDGAALTLLPFALVPAVVIKRGWLKILMTSYVLFFFIVIYSKDLPGISHALLFNRVLVSVSFLIAVVWFVSHLQSWISEVENQNVTLKEQKEELQILLKENKVKTELIAILSHDLKGPSIAFSQLSDRVAFLIRKGQYDTLLSLADSFENMNKRLFSNIDHLLNWAITQKSEIGVVIDEFLLSEVVDEQIDKLTKAYPNLELKINIDQSLISPIHTDRQLISIILTNILDNAIKYSTSHPIVDIWMVEEDAQYLIFVKDYGPGMSQAKIDRIKSGVHEKSKNGYGLGLGMCLELSKALNGSLNIHSVIEKGTTVELMISKYMSDDDNAQSIPNH